MLELRCYYHWPDFNKRLSLKVTSYRKDLSSFLDIIVVFTTALRKRCNTTPLTAQTYEFFLRTWHVFIVTITITDGIFVTCTIRADSYCFYCIVLWLYEEIHEFSEKRFRSKNNYITFSWNFHRFFWNVLKFIWNHFRYRRSVKIYWTGKECE